MMDKRMRDVVASAALKRLAFPALPAYEREALRAAFDAADHHRMMHASAAVGLAGIAWHTGRSMLDALHAFAGPIETFAQRFRDGLPVVREPGFYARGTS